MRMDKSLKAKLEVNNVSVALNPFVDEFLTRTVIGAVSSLKGAKSIQGLALHLEGDDVQIVVNGSELPLTSFPKEIIISTIIGLVSPLKGVDEARSLRINIGAEQPIIDTKVTYSNGDDP
jgi:hypothetical protein